MADLPREEILRHANAVLKRFPAGSYVHFKFTCEECGERNSFNERNTLFATGDCAACGHTNTVTQAGYLLVVPTGTTDEAELPTDPQ